MGVKRPPAKRTRAKRAPLEKINGLLRLSVHVETEVRRHPKNSVETQRGRTLAPIPLLSPGLTHCPAHPRPRWFPLRYPVRARGFRTVQSYFPLSLSLGQRTPRSSYPRAMLSLRSAAHRNTDDSRYHYDTLGVQPPFPTFVQRSHLSLFRFLMCMRVRCSSTSGQCGRKGRVFGARRLACPIVKNKASLDSQHSRSLVTRPRGLILNW